MSNINSSYNGLIAEVQNRSNQYVQFDANYTWSHSLDYNQNQSTSPSSNNWYDPLGNPDANYGNSNFNVPNRFVTWAMLQYPGRSHTWMRFLTDGWHMNPILQIAEWPAVFRRRKRHAGCGGRAESQTRSGMNGSGSSGYLLQLGRNTYKLPMTTVLDLRVQKDVRISERFNLELLGETFNVLNHQNVTGVNATAYSINATASSTTPANSLVYQPAQGAGVNASGFGTATNADSNFVYSQRQIQAGRETGLLTSTSTFQSNTRTRRLRSPRPCCLHYLLRSFRRCSWRCGGRRGRYGRFLRRGRGRVGWGR